MMAIPNMVTPEQLAAHTGKLENASASSRYDCTVCGNALEMYIVVENGVITRASAVSEGCGYCGRCAATAAVLAVGRAPEEAAYVADPQDIMNIVGENLTDKKDGPLYAAAALKLAVHNWRKAQQAAA